MAQVSHRPARFFSHGELLLILAAGILLACGIFAIVQAATGHFLPHDATYLEMTAQELCALDSCRILYFMIHDRISFGGVLIAIGVLYLWLTLVPLRGRESWAWWTLAMSGTAGFLSFLAYLGYGYLDTWHGAATLALLPVFVGGLVRTRGLRHTRLAAGQTIALRPTHAGGRWLLLLASFGIVVGGVTIMTVGMTSVFVPQDLAFMAMTHEGLHAVNPRLVPLIAHDRAGFGGALASFGVGMFGCVRYARPSRELLWVLAFAGTVGFGSAIGVHPVIGYVSLTHLGPAFLGCAVFAAGLGLIARDLSREPAS